MFDIHVRVPSSCSSILDPGDIVDVDMVDDDTVDGDTVDDDTVDDDVDELSEPCSPIHVNPSLPQTKPPFLTSCLITGVLVITFHRDIPYWTDH